jgi:hypothetical protein
LTHSFLVQHLLPGFLRERHSFYTPSWLCDQSLSTLHPGPTHRHSFSHQALSSHRHGKPRQDAGLPGPLGRLSRSNASLSAHTSPSPALSGRAAVGRQKVSCFLDFFSFPPGKDHVRTK